MTTIFDRIVAGEIPYHKVWEDQNHLAFLDINPRTRGHTLVIPKRGTDYLFDLSGAEMAALWEAARHTAAKLKAKLGCSRVCVWVYGFEVPHVHIHLLPMNSLEDLPLPPVDMAAKSDLAATATLLGV